MSGLIFFFCCCCCCCDDREKRPGVWAVLKSNIGKDFSRIAIPIQFNEPLSALQKWSEDIEYADMLDTAFRLTNPQERLAYIAAFHCSHYSDTMHRLYKPFNPILGETFELVRDDIGEGVRYFSEQVSHHPPVSACHSIGAIGWEYSTTLDVKNAFKGKDMEVYPQGTSHIRFPNGDHFTYKRATTCVRNIIVGRMWVDNVSFLFCVSSSSNLGMFAHRLFLKVRRGQDCEPQDGRLLRAHVQAVLIHQRRGGGGDWHSL